MKYTAKLTGYDTTSSKKVQKEIQVNSKQEAEKWCDDNTYMGGYEWYVDLLVENIFVKQVVELMYRVNTFTIRNKDDKILDYFKNKTEAVDGFYPVLDPDGKLRIIIVIKDKGTE